MRSKIYFLINNSKIYDHYSYSEKIAKYITCDTIPFLYYPNMKPCFEANAYMIYLYRKNLSTLNGGTALTYAKKISLLIKFLHEQPNKMKFTELNDNHMFQFVDFLKQREISATHLINVFKQCIDFLLFISSLYMKKEFIGIGNKYQIKLRISKRQGSGNHSNFTFTHLALPKPNYRHPVQPISNENIKKIRNIVICQKDIDLRLRNLCILDLLEFTGARRTEIIKLLVNNVKKSNLVLESESLPLLELNTLKKRNGNNIRSIPIPQNLLNNLLKYIRIYRNPLIKKYKLEDHGFLFISHRNGNPLSSDTLTTYINTWSKNAYIEPLAHAHQFRHRFITEKFKSLILQHNINNPDTFSRLLISHESLKQKVLQWTGHSNIESLNPYIHLAISELTNLDESLSQVEIKSSVKYLKSSISDLVQQFENKNISSKTLFEELKKITDD